MKKFKLVLIGIGILICAILVVAGNNKEKMPSHKSAPVQQGSIDACGLESEWLPPYPFGI